MASARTEIVLALTSQVGTGLNTVREALKSYLQNDYGYRVEVIRVSDQLHDLALPVNIDDSSAYKRYLTRMEAGSKARERYGLDALARLVAFQIAQRRAPDTANEPVAYLVHQLKHPAEVSLLRQVYGPGFFLIGVFASEERRSKRLTDTLRMTKEQCQELLDIDLDEAGRKHGQKSSSTFERADVFVSCAGDEETTAQLQRFVDLVFGDPFTTPTRDEYSMFLAYAASLRSAEMGRQVGAVVLSQSGEVLSIGANEVPRQGGGLYWAGDDPDGRDFAGESAKDSNHYRRNTLIADLAADLHIDSTQGSKLEAITNRLKGITEYGRSVHAEMEALLACARVGVSPCHGTLFATTFPCHNCARHIIASGIRRVVFIEPYPKSLAPILHKDAIELAAPGDAAAKSFSPERSPVFFEPFVGVGPRRYLDLFSLTLSAGTEVLRKRREGDHELPDRAPGKDDPDWKSKATPRVPLHKTSYLEREEEAVSGAEVKKPVSEMLKKET